MTRRIRWLAFWEWLWNCPLLPAPKPRAPEALRESLADCLRYGPAESRVSQDVRHDATTLEIARLYRLQQVRTPVSFVGDHA